MCASHRCCPQMMPNNAKLAHNKFSIVPSVVLGKKSSINSTVSSAKLVSFPQTQAQRALVAKIRFLTVNNAERERKRVPVLLVLYAKILIYQQKISNNA